ncbi:MULTISPECIES: DUF1622 domain-containing protein [Mycobacterium]|jgi:uncharacterized membrane protein|uniref:DUF1622 domain-containing protein n=1 Tax=Mycobacterium gordonae TaxID=1778 RepID=A0A1A6B9S7_MYCGO|nr:MULTISPECIES: DUF1622 domain-containing protein [Mycobacterium]MBI2701893.1 DUF1622 domain-containing protein [Mycobacterium sp.]MBX9983483.1 DUF1622 domain-containing protein [Mycobacterium gordonae]MCQ4363704.1 DUF1622 domain-containing protein [Mycobacterium gordonae]MCV7005919.1 DUF1622 domain-containing protein [Mycobacterium gordonae]OBR99072.1 hypothetical protein A9W98_32255 [Mycobacterium gordonae]
MNLLQIVDHVGSAIDVAGVSVIVIGCVIACSLFLARVARQPDQAYRDLRNNLGRAILIGLEFLVAGDIVKTIVVTPNTQHVAALAGVVAIRTFLSLSLTVEMTGKWPWREADSKAEAA